MTGTLSKTEKAKLVHLLKELAATSKKSAKKVNNYRIMFDLQNTASG